MDNNSLAIPNSSSDMAIFEPKIDKFDLGSTKEKIVKRFDEDHQIGLVANTYFGETDENRASKVREFKIRLQLCHPELLINLPDDRDAFLLKMLRAGGYDVSAATTLLKSYIEMMRGGPKYFSPAFEDGLSTVKKGFDQKMSTVLPSRDKYGRRVYIWRPGKWDPEELPCSDVFCCAYMLCEMVAREQTTQITGITNICDGSNFGLKQFTSLSFEDLRYCAMFLQDLPAWFRAIHLINFPYYMSMVYQAVKPLLSQNVKDSIIFHDSNDSLHEYVDKEILPEELGGNAGQFDNQESAEAVYAMTNYFKELKSYVYPENEEE